MAGAISACRLQGMMGHPSQHEVEEMVHEKMTQNCPIKPQDVTNAYKIFGPDLAGMRGKSVRKKTRIEPEYVEIPDDIIE